jgi:hypothetical protein
MKMTPKQAERLGQIVEGCENALHVAKLNLPARIHVEGLSEKLREVRDEAASLVREITGEDPWETNPLRG